MNNKLQGKDLINIGIFTAIYFIVIFAAASIGFIPIFIPLISVIVPLVGGIPMMLFFSKIKKFGMLTICGVLLGIIMLLTGMGWWCIPTGLIFGLISDFMMKACDYKNAKREVLIHGVFSMWVIGAFIPIVVTLTTRTCSPATVRNMPTRSWLICPTGFCRYCLLLLLSVVLSAA